MIRRLPSRLAVPVTFLIVATLSAAPAQGDGTQTGIITGLVLDATGTAIEGVEVTLSGARGSSFVLTDEAGRFRFPGLDVGGYEVVARLLGLSASAASVTVSQGRATELRLVLSPEDEAPGNSLLNAERIVVVSEPPIIDRSDPRVATAVRADFLSRLPVRRFYQSAALVIPGLEGGADGNPNASGSLRSTNLYLIDGVDTTDPTTGLFGLNLAYGAIEEVDVTTAAAPADTGRSSGAFVRVVTRSGGNRFRGSLEWLATDGSWNEPYVQEPTWDHLAADVSAANGAEELSQTVGLTVGGPVAADRLWFFVAYEDGEGAFPRPARDGSRWDDRLSSESFAGKLTLRAGTTGSVAAQVTSDETAFTLFSPFQRGPGENRVGDSASPIARSFVDRLTGDVYALERRGQEGSFARLAWNGVRGDRWTFSASGAIQDRRLDRSAAAARGLSGGAPHAAVTAFDLDPDDETDAQIFDYVLFNGVTDLGEERRERAQLHFDLAWYLEGEGVEHEIELGVQGFRTASTTNLRFPGQRVRDPATGTPVEGQLYIDIDLRSSCLPDGSGCRPFDPAEETFQPYQMFLFHARPSVETRAESYAGFLSDSIAWGRFQITAGVRFEWLLAKDDASRKLLDDETILPRLSVVWDSTGRGDTLFTAAWGRYAEPFLQQFVDSFRIPASFSGYSDYFWSFDDPSCDDRAPRDPLARCWQHSSTVELGPIQNAEPSLDLAQATVDEAVVGFERQLSTTTAVSLHYVAREWRGLWDNVLARQFDGDGETTRSEVRNLSAARRRHRALQLLVQKRFAAGWQLLASYTRAETLGNLFESTGLSDFADYGDESDVNLVHRYGLAPYDRKHQGKLFAHVAVPAGRVTLDFGAAVRYESGAPIQVERSEPLGRRFLTPRGSDRLDDILQADLAIAASTRVGSSSELTIRLESFNLTDEQRPVAVETLVDRSDFGEPRTLADLQAPRSYRISAAIRF